VAERGRRQSARPRARPTGRVVPFPRKRRGGRLELSRLAPSGRSLFVAFALLLAGVGAYAGARQSSVFAVHELEVRGTSPQAAQEVRRALAAAMGESLLTLDLPRLEAAAAAVPSIARARLDRGFPNTLRITVVPEQPVAVVRQAGRSWLVAEGGRVVASLAKGKLAALPRIWLRPGSPIVLGSTLTGEPLAAVAAVAPLVERPLGARVTSVRATEEELTLVLRSGIELRLGDASDLDLKLAVARRILPALAGAGGYLDVSVPERPVAAETLDPQVEVDASTSTLT
jgi:cell division protein FtsQ